MNKNYETAQQLGEALDFVSNICEKSDCDVCIFADQDASTCCFYQKPANWDVNTVILNMGIRLGEEEKHE